MRTIHFFLFSLLSLAGLTIQAQDIDVAAANGPHPFSFSAGLVVSQSIGVVAMAAPVLTPTVIWEFDIPPAGCAGGATSCTVSGITVTLPAGSPAPVSNALRVNITAAAGAATVGTFNFTLRVTEVGGATPRTQLRDYLVNITPQAMDIVLVLDESGSMGASVGVSGDRMDVLHTAANLFLTGYRDFATPSIQKSIGITSFASGVRSPAGAALRPIDAAGFTAMQTYVNSLVPTSATAIGEGLANAKTKLAASTGKRAVVLFTDGDQNVSPCVDADGIRLMNSCFGAGAPTGQTISAPNMEIHTVGTGTAAVGAGADLLTNISNANNGDRLLTTAMSEMGMAADEVNAYFQQRLTDLVNASPQISERKKGVIKPNIEGAASRQVASGVAEETFVINKNIKKIAFEVTFSGLRAFSFPPTVFSMGVEKDGKDMGQFGGRLERGQGFCYYSLNIPEGRTGVKSEGTWKVRIRAPYGLSYMAVAIPDDHFLDYTVKEDKTVVRLGEKITASAKLTYIGRPLTTNTTVKALFLKPGEDLYDLVARGTANFDPQTGPDAASLGYQKFLQMLRADSNFAKAIALKGKPLIELKHVANGEYRGEFTETDFTGNYQVFYFIEGNTPASGAFRREVVHSITVMPLPVDPKVSQQQLTTDAKGNIIYTFTPMYSFKGKTRFLGPMYGNALKVDGAGVTVNGVKDNANGSYTLSLSGDPNANITLSLLGQKLYTGSASKIDLAKGAGSGSGSSGGDNFLDGLKAWLESVGLPGWLIYLIMLLAGLLVAWGVFRKKQS